MIIKVEQKNKELFEASFDIISNNNTLGTIFIKGKMGSMEVSLKGIYNNTSFEFEYIGDLINNRNKFRPYKIIESTNSVGEIYQTNKKTGLFSGYEYITLIYKNIIYTEYGVDLGKEAKCPVYLNDNQIAQIEKNGIVYNDLHNYKIYIKDNKYSFISVLFACYMYINGCFKPGVKVKKSIAMSYDKTINKELNSKYNPDWIKSIGDE